MVSLLTQYSTGFSVQVPVIDPRLIPHVDVPVVADQEERPVETEVVPEANQAPE